MKSLGRMKYPRIVVTECTINSAVVEIDDGRRRLVIETSPRDWVRQLSNAAREIARRFQRRVDALEVEAKEIAALAGKE